MATVKQLVEALSVLPQDDEIYYAYWCKNDIDELLKERDENNKSSSTAEWDLWVNRMMDDTPLSNVLWEAANEYIIQLIAEREKRDSARTN